MNNQVFHWFKIGGIYNIAETGTNVQTRVHCKLQLFITFFLLIADT